MRSRLLARNSAWTALELSLDIVGNALLGIVVARTLGPTMLGDYAYVSWLSMLAASFAVGGVTAATGKYASEYAGRGELPVVRTLVRKSLGWQSLLGVVVCGSLLAVTAVELPRSSMVWASLAIASLVPAMLTGVWARGIDATQRFQDNCLPSIVANTTIILIGLLAMAFGWGLVGLASALLLGRLLDAVLRRWSFNWSYRQVDELASLPHGLAARFRTFAWRTSLMLLPAMVLWDRSEVFFIRRYSAPAEVAFYSVSFGLARQVFMLLQPFLTPITSNMLVEYGRGLESTTRMASTALRYCLILALPLGWGLSSVGANAVVLIYGPAYAPTAKVLAIVAFFGAAQPLVVPMRQALMAAERQQFLTVWAFVFAGANVCLDLLLIPHYGAAGAAVANGIAQTAAMLSLFAYASKSIGLRLSVADVTRPVGSAALMAVVGSVVSRSGPPLVAVPAAVIAGGLVYVLMLRVTRAFDGQDRARLLEVGRMLPAQLRGVFVALVSLVAR